ncbi:MAG TPA: GAF domain-containing protein [Cytophagaceae bacterium]|nr:GAF domain-containing protein [Cytophagaceae bacterium]
MKKNLIVSGLLLLYTSTFIFLFTKLRKMSGVVIEELVEQNIYYILGFMFIAGISSTLYLILDANNTKYKLANEEKSEEISYQEEASVGKVEEEDNLDVLKSEIKFIYDLDIPKNEKSEKAIWKICKHFEISQALYYVKEEEREQLTLQSSFAFILSESDPRYILVGEGITGQAVLDKKPYYVKNVPEGYLKVISGLGESLPKSLLIIPCVDQEEVRGVFEFSSLKEYSKNTFDDIVMICNYVSTLSIN